MNTRECVHLVTSSYYLSHNKDGDHATRSAVAENPMLHAHITALCVIDAELLPIEFSTCGKADFCWHAGFCCGNTGWLMESNSALQMNEREKRNGPSEKWAFNLFLKFWKCQMTGLLLVVCSMELRDCRVLPSGVEKEQCLQRLIGRAHWDVQCHGQLWRPEDRACTRLTEASAANEVYRAADQIRVSADQNGRQVALLHSSPDGADSEHAVNC